MEHIADHLRFARNVYKPVEIEIRHQSDSKTEKRIMKVKEVNKDGTAALMIPAAANEADSEDEIIEINSICSISMEGIELQ